MKKIYVEARRKFNLSEVNFRCLNKLPKGLVSLAATVQYLSLIKPTEEYLKKSGREVLIKKGAWHEGHVLGCNSFAFDTSADVFLLISDGKFHALNNAIQIQKPIYVFTSKNLEVLSERDLEKHNKITLSKKKKFLSSENIGILLSTKDGQKFHMVRNLKKRIESIGKKAFVFEADNLNPSNLESFPQIGIWINTACYGLARDDKRIINLKDIIGYI